MAQKPIQRGKFYKGTSGYPIRITLNLSFVDLVSLDVILTNPSTNKLTRSVPLDNVVDEAKGTFDFIPQEGDLKASGIYGITIKVTHTDDRVLTVDGSFQVE